MVGVGDQSGDQSAKRAIVPFGLRFTETVPVDREPQVEYDETKQIAVYCGGGGTPFGQTNTAFADSDTTT